MLRVFFWLRASRLSPFGLALVIIALASSSSPALMLPILSQGGTYVWISGSSGSGNWSTSTNWTVSGGTNPGPIPDASATVDILDGNQPSETVTYNYTGTAVTLSGLFIGDGTNTGSPGTGVNTLSIGSGYTLSSTIEDVGDGAGFSYGQGAILQSGGTNNGGTGLGLTLNLGYNSTDTGQYTLQGGALNALTENIGYFGTGIFTQTGGTNTASGLTLSAEGGSNGTYNLNAGTLTVNNSINLNGNGTTGGTFNLNSAATLSYNTFNQAGGAFNGNLTNTTNFVYTAGTYTGELINASSGTATISGANSATFSPTAGIDNSGILSLTNGGAIGGGSFVTNEATGTIDGYGSIENTGSFTNLNLINANAGKLLTISGQSPVTNSGTMESSNGSTLHLTGLTINNSNGTLLVSGSAAFLIIDSTVVEGGTLNSSNGAILLQGNTSNPELNGNIYGPVTNNGTVTAEATSNVIVGTITDNGAINLATELQIGDGTTTFARLQSNTGTGGTVTLTQSSAEIAGLAGTETLTNDDAGGISHVIQGQGTIQNLGTLTNNGTIDANASTALTIQTIAAVSNSNTLEATGGGLLNLSGLHINNSAGNISAAANSFVNISSTSVEGGMLTVAATGDMNLQGTDPELDGNLHGAMTVSAGSIITAGAATNVIAGVIDNYGTINASNVVQVGDGNTGSATLSGTGVLRLAQGSSVSGSSLSTLTNSSGHTIQGQGTIQSLGLLSNSGTIDANGSSALVIQSITSVGNSNTIEATGGGLLNLSSLTINNSAGSGGNITASGAGFVLISSSVVQGGTLNAVSGSIIMQGTDPELDGGSRGLLTISSNSVITASAATNVLAGTIDNYGAINASGVLQVGDGTTGSLTLSGTGSITMETNSSMSGPGNTLANNAGHTIEGQGIIQNLGQITNYGMIDGNAPSPLTLQNITTTVVNGGQLEGNGGTLTLSGLTINNSAGSGGTISAASGGFVLIASTIVEGGTLGTTGTGAILLQGNYPELDGNSHGSLTINGNSTIDANATNASVIAGTIVDNGNINVSSGLQVGDGTATSSDLQTTGNGTLTMAQGGSTISGYLSTNILINDTGHTIQGQGTIQNILITNNGTINANQPAKALTISEPGISYLLSVGNSGVMEATDGGNLSVQLSASAAASALFDFGNSGSIAAIGLGSTVTIGPPTTAGGFYYNLLQINGGTVSSSVGATIRGQGAFYFPVLTNAGTVNANVDGGTMLLFPATGSTNTGTLEATNGGQLVLTGGSGANIDNTGGTITTDGYATSATDYSNVLITSDFIVSGGTIAAPQSTVQHILVTSGADLNGNPNTLTLQGPIYAGGLVMAGSIDLQPLSSISAANPQGMTISIGDPNLNSATLSGSGGITMASADKLTGTAGDGSSNLIIGSSNTIAGAGTIQNLIVTNNGTINANQSRQSLTIEDAQTSYVSNAATMEATNGGILSLMRYSPVISRFVIVNTGTIAAAGTGSTITLGPVTASDNDNGVEIDGGTITSTADAAITGQGVVALSELTNAGTFNANVNGGIFALTNLGNGSTNTGTLEATNGGNLSILTSTITGSGTVSADTVSTVEILGSTVSAANLFNAGTAQILGGSTVTISNPVTNEGTIYVTGSTFHATGGFTVHGSLITDPSTLEFQYLDIASNGSISGSPGDTYIVDTNLMDDSMPDALSTAGVDLEFSGSGVHDLSTDNGLRFADLDLLDAGASLDLTGTGSLFFDEIILPDENPPDIGSELQGDLAITYDANNPANAYLLDATYALPGGGSLTPVNAPEPTCAGMIAMAGCGLLGRRRQRS